MPAAVLPPSDDRERLRGRIAATALVMAFGVVILTLVSVLA